MEEYIKNFEECEYCEQTNYDHETGYYELWCSFITGKPHDYLCHGGEIEYGCPFSFRYEVIER